MKLFKKNYYPTHKKKKSGENILKIIFTASAIKAGIEP